MQNINFLPWIGKNYQTGLGPKGLRVLVLGESHYCFTLGQGKCPGCSLQNCIAAGFTKEDFEQQTIEYIKDILFNNKGLPYQQTALSFERAIVGKKKLTQAEREDFWNSVIFYNYIQKSLPKLDGKRTEFTANDLVGSDSAFDFILGTYLPDLIIVWGFRLFKILPPWGSVRSELELSSGEKTDIRMYYVCGKSIPAIKVAHPSCPKGRQWEYWHQFYDVFLE